MNNFDSNTWYVMGGAIPIEYENCDKSEHQAPWYFCNKPDCPCHNDPELTAALQSRVKSGEITAAQALDIYWNQVQP